LKRIFPGYYIVAASFVIQGTYLGAFFSFNVLTPDLAAEFGWERATITTALSINFLVMGVSVMFMGRLTDRLGPRWVLALASIIYGLGYLLLSQVQAVWQLYLNRLTMVYQAPWADHWHRQIRCWRWPTPVPRHRCVAGL
jgi:sugar phosphate permease